MLQTQLAVGKREVTHKQWMEVIVNEGVFILRQVDINYKTEKGRQVLSQSKKQI